MLNAWRVFPLNLIYSKFLIFSLILIKISRNLYKDEASIEVKSAEEQEAVGADTDEEDADRIYTFDADEGPGIYGEVVDYWRTQEDNNDITDEDKTYKSTV